MLYGDDDTFFFVDGVLELLQDFDPSLPYFITGASHTRLCLCVLYILSNVYASM